MPQHYILLGEIKSKRQVIVAVVSKAQGMPPWHSMQFAMQQCWWCLLSDHISKPRLTHIRRKIAHMHMQSTDSAFIPACLETQITSSHAYPSYSGDSKRHCWGYLIIGAAAVSTQSDIAGLFT